eukprot:Rmarinus@m.16245
MDRPYRSLFTNNVDTESPVPDLDRDLADLKTQVDMLSDMGKLAQAGVAREKWHIVRRDMERDKTKKLAIKQSLERDHVLAQEMQRYREEKDAWDTRVDDYKRETAQLILRFSRRHEEELEIARQAAVGRFAKKVIRSDKAISYLTQADTLQRARRFAAAEELREKARIASEKKQKALDQERDDYLRKKCHALTHKQRLELSAFAQKRKTVLKEILLQREECLRVMRLRVKNHCLNLRSTQNIQMNKMQAYFKKERQAFTEPRQAPPTILGTPLTDMPVGKPLRRPRSAAAVAPTNASPAYDTCGRRPKKRGRRPLRILVAEESCMRVASTPLQRPRSAIGAGGFCAIEGVARSAQSVLDEDFRCLPF